MTKRCAKSSGLAVALVVVLVSLTVCSNTEQASAEQPTQQASQHNYTIGVDTSTSEPVDLSQPAPVHELTEDNIELATFTYRWIVLLYVRDPWYSSVWLASLVVQTLTSPHSSTAMIRQALEAKKPSKP
jgi:hypothetical protein